MIRDEKAARLYNPTTECRTLTAGFLPFFIGNFIEVE